jgi:hypothetical protein
MADPVIAGAGLLKKSRQGEIISPWRFFSLL